MGQMSRESGLLCPEGAVRKPALLPKDLWRGWGQDLSPPSARSPSGGTAWGQANTLTGFHELQRSPRGDLVPEPKQAKLLI